jgi:hypothetical protein
MVVQLDSIVDKQASAVGEFPQLPETDAVQAVLFL